MTIAVDKLLGLNPTVRSNLLTAIDAAGWPTRLGEVFYVDPTDGSDTSSGKTKDTALASLDAAVNLCVANRGDVIIRMRGGETVTSQINFDVAGVTVIAENYGVAPWASGEYFSTLADASFTDGPVAKVTAPTALIGLGFVSRDAGATFFSGAALLLGGDADANPFGAYVYGCRFPKWGLDNRIGIAVEGSSNCTIEACDFEGVGSALEAGIYVQGAAQNLNILRNHFRQCTTAVQFGAFAGGGPHVVIGENVVEDGTLLDTQANTGNGIIYGNWLETATDTASYDVAVSTLKTNGFNPSGNHYVE